MIFRKKHENSKLYRNYKLQFFFFNNLNLKIKYKIKYVIYFTLFYNDANILKSDLKRITVIEIF